MNPTDAGFLALREDKFQAAHVQFRAAVEGDPQNARAWKGLVECCRQLSDWEGALSALDGVINTSTAPSEVRAAYHFKGRLYDERLNKTRKARAHYERALQFQDDDVFAYLALAELALREKKWQMAVAQADHGLQFSQPDDPQRAWFLLIRAIGQRRSTMSVGPVSTFFNQLGASKGDDALAQAHQSWNGLQRLIPANPLDHPDKAAAAVQKHLPRPILPSWWQA